MPTAAPARRIGPRLAGFAAVLASMPVNSNWRGRRARFAWSG
ncbi:hypothetical protein BN2497_4547 [Janthinobacterium sp. CG23_2]|nr:hypothetical protein BN2497_4547 [Janthinobacterium sp. CG23_2]CUU28671.1 hypothetical protein BN3177_4547 [Janthinobacterium sp. CG23_2]